MNFRSAMLPGIASAMMLIFSIAQLAYSLYSQSLLKSVWSAVFALWAILFAIWERKP
jgi:hypothetical protein